VRADRVNRKPVCRPYPAGVEEFRSFDARKGIRPAMIWILQQF
jgi:hypothetical protein